jgi:hypothetical protein
MFKLWSPERVILDKWYACSSKCLEIFAHRVEQQVEHADPELINNLPNSTAIFVLNTLNSGPSLTGLSFQAFSKKYTVNFAPSEEVDTNPRDNLLWKRLLRLREYYDQAQETAQLPNWIKAGRFEDVAQYYEKRGMYEEAGKARAKSREIIVKSTNITFDLNTMLKQIADGGIVAIYRCPKCGGKLKISKETTTANLRTCEHCSSEIQTMDLVDFMKAVLS